MKVQKKGKTFLLPDLQRDLFRGMPRMGKWAKEKVVQEVFISSDNLS